MSGYWYEPDRPVFHSAAGGEATLGAIFSAAMDASRFVDNTFAAEDALERAYDQRNRTIFDLTGEKLSNPMRVTYDAWRTAAPSNEWYGSLLSAGQLEIRQRQQADWLGQVRSLADRRPELAGQLLPAQTIEDQALAVSRDADERFSRLAGSRDGAGKWIAAFAGAAWGGMRDPVQVGALAAGGGPGAARTIGGRIMTTALTEAAVNAGVEAAMQPIVQAYRARAGLDAGMDEAIRNVAFAGALGGLLGGAGRALAEGLTYGGRSGRKALAAAVNGLPPQVRQELDAGLPDLPQAIREALPAEARGAVDAAEAMAHVDLTRPAGALPEHHDLTVGRAQRTVEAMDAGEQPPPLPYDEAQLQRIADTVMPRPAVEPAAAPSLVEFLAARGGIQDFGGELAAIGADGLSARFKTGGRPKTMKLVTRDGMSLDYAREAAEEAGYIASLDADRTTTVAELLDAIDGEARGHKVYSREDQEAQRAAGDWDAGRARVESELAQVLEQMGPAVDDALAIDALETMARTGESAAEAVERVLIRAELADPRPSMDERLADIPGWDEAELLGASQARGAEPQAMAGDPFDDPAAVPPEFVAFDASPRPSPPHREPPLSIDVGGLVGGGFWQGTLAEAVRLARDYAIARFAGRTVRNRSDDAAIILAKKGIKHSVSHNPSRPALAASLRLDELVAGATHVATEPDRQGRAHIRAVHHYERDVSVDGRAHMMRIVVMEHDDARRYYDHFRIFDGDGPTQPVKPAEAPIAVEAGPSPGADIGDPAAAGNVSTELVAGESGPVPLSALLDEADALDELAATARACKA